MRVKDITSFLESWAPLAYQESYDNAGLITGSPDQEVSSVLVTLDCLEEVVDEAIARKANMIIAHHPIVFKGLKKFNGKNYVERTVIKAIRNDIAIYAIHTNLDNVYNGVNQRICDKIGLTETTVLSPRPETLAKLETFIPHADVEHVMEAVHTAGAGQIGNYKQCSFRTAGQGTFLPTGAADPHIGKHGTLEKVEETKVEVIFPVTLTGQVLAALKQAHPYEEVAYYISSLENDNQEVGAGMIGKLEQPEEPMIFLQRLKERMELSTIRHTRPLQKKVERVAVCGGAGSFLLPQAIRRGADVYISADFKYHEFFDADKKIMVADIGHYESEVFTKELIKEVLTKKFPTFAINFSNTVTNPISYL